MRKPWREEPSEELLQYTLGEADGKWGKNWIGDSHPRKRTHRARGIHLSLRLFVEVSHVLIYTTWSLLFSWSKSERRRGRGVTKIQPYSSHGRLLWLNVSVTKFTERSEEQPNHLGVLWNLTFIELTNGSYRLYTTTVFLVSWPHLPLPPNRYKSTVQTTYRSSSINFGDTECVFCLGSSHHPMQSPKEWKDPVHTKLYNSQE